MAAYAALVSLSKVIDLALSQKQEYVLPYSREQMMSLHERLGCLQGRLEDLSGRSHPSIDVLESRIRDVAYQLEDIIEGYISRSLREKFADSYLKLALSSSTFGCCDGEINLVLLEEAMTRKMKEENLQDKDTSGASHPLTTGSSSSEPHSAKLIMGWIFGRSSSLEIVPITGMGGIGKTTVARVVYEHPGTPRHFDICSWVTVSQEFDVEEILRGLLPSEEQGASSEGLIECVHKRLTGRSYLIVLDDMWDVNAWDGVRNAFPDDKKGSRIILTTRLLDVATCVGSSNHVHQMPFLDEEQSWDLLQEKVGRNELLLEELEGLGRRISRNCRGLPLAIVAISGLLKFNMRKGYWERVARDTKSEMAGNYDHLFDILGLSYTNLPAYLKACFLYFGLFREDEEISREELVRLWTAEGFLKARGPEEMEDVAEEYLEELVARSLVLVKKKWPDGKIKTCSVHDLLRDLSLRKAHDDKFSQHITWKDRHSSIKNVLRRASIAFNCFTEELELDHHTHVRSLRYTETADRLSIIRHLRLIRVLGEVGITTNSQLSFLYELTNLRYLHIYLEDSRLEFSLPLTVGESISKLQNLETLIFSGSLDAESGSLDAESETYVLTLPSEIWEMPRLRHLILLGKSRLTCPALGELSCSGLQTLTEVTNLDLTMSITAKLSNLKKLIMLYDHELSEDATLFHLNNLVYLHQLQELTISCAYNDPVIDISFPRKLRKLSLKNTEVPVENMSLIGSLLNLEVLKLKDNAFSGEVWEPIEGQFVQLKYLKMEWLDQLTEWRAESEHFPQLEMLKIKCCRYLEEVPTGMGEINTLKKLVLERCRAAEESVEEIKSLKESCGNDLLQVIIIRVD